MVGHKFYSIGLHRSVITLVSKTEGKKEHHIKNAYIGDG